MEDKKTDFTQSNESYYDDDSGSKRNKIIIGALAALLVISLVVIFFSYQKQGELEDKNEMTQRELLDTSSRLDAISRELDEKIEEISKLGGDIEELQAAKAEVEEEKEALRKSSGIQISRLRERVKGYETLLKNKDEEITKLKMVADSLMTENTELKNQQNELQEVITVMETDKGKLEEQVAFASRLKAENIAVFAVNKNGKEREGEFKNRQLEKLKVAFNIAENNVAPIEGKEIMVRVIEPAGNVIFDVATGSGTFMINGREEFYTIKQDILFDNTRQQLTFLYEKPTDYEPGQYTLEVYTDDYVMGTSTFTVK